MYSLQVLYHLGHGIKAELFGFYDLSGPLEADTGRNTPGLNSRIPNKAEGFEGYMTIQTRCILDCIHQQWF